MMPDLGTYATEVLSAYAVGLLLLIAIIGISVVQRRAAARALEEFEQGD